MKKTPLMERLRRLIALHNSPEEIALGVAIGVWIAVMPLYGFHTILVIIFAFLVRKANKIAILLGTNISLPPTVPFITWAGYEIGRMFLRGGYPPLNWQAFKGFTYKSIFKFYYPLLLGSFVLGMGCAILFYFLTLWFVKRRRRLHAG